MSFWIVYDLRDKNNRILVTGTAPMSNEMPLPHKCRWDFVFPVDAVRSVGVDVVSYDDGDNCLCDLINKRLRNLLEAQRRSEMNILTSLLKKSIEIVSMVLKKPKFTDVLLALVGWIPSLVNQIGEMGNLNDKQKVDEALQSIDDFTGVDTDALDLIRDLPADAEEALFDHLTEVIRILAYNRLKVQGYYVEDES